MSRLPARTGIAWLKEGFGLFRQQPGILTMLLFAYFLAGVLLNIVPLVGLILTVALFPAFSIAIMQACNLIAQGQRVMPSVLLTGLRQPALTRLLKLGMVYVGLALIMAIILWLNVDEATLRQMQSSAEAARAASQSGAPVTMPDYPASLLVVPLVWGVLLLLLTFTAPLTYWKQMPVFKALFYSVFGIAGAFKAVFVMMFSAVGIFYAVMLILRLLFGRSTMLFEAITTWMLFMLSLIIQCGMFAAYRQIYADPAPEAKL